MKVEYFDITFKELYDKVKNLLENNIFEEIFKFSNNKILDMSNKNEEIIKSYLKILDTIKKKLNNTSN